MEKIVYLLGAGFSVSAGLPLMGNFLERSKDLYFGDPIRFDSFKKVFEIIDRMAKCKNFFKTDLWNIEDILSILEMQESLAAKTDERSFINYICDVITNTTQPDETDKSHSWKQCVFGKPLLDGFRMFVASLHGFSHFVHDGKSATAPRYAAGRLKTPRQSYSVITLNYDQVLENAANFLNRSLRTQTGFRFPGADTTNNDWPWLVKLHGCVSNREIIPPTWSKKISPAIQSNWQKAMELLSEANYIRIIGYSLPTTDAYVKYLLRAAVIESKHLKRIDVLCLDNGSAKARYDEFITFHNYHFCGDTTAAFYMANITGEDVHGYPNEITVPGLEFAHGKFFPPPLV